MRPLLALVRPLRSALPLSLLLFACDSRSPEAIAPPAAGDAKDPSAHASKAPPAADAESSPAPEDEALEQIAGIYYREYVSGGADADTALPMIIAIHGLGDSPADFEGLFRGFNRPARIIVPRGLEAYGTGWSWFPSSGGSGDFTELSKNIRAAADQLAPAIEALVKQRPTAGKPAVTGFSQGGMLSFTLAVHHGELLSAAYPIGGVLPEPLWPGPDVDPSTIPPIIAFHGEADDRVPYLPTRRVVEHLKSAGYRVELRSYANVGHTINRPMHGDLMATFREHLGAP